MAQEALTTFRSMCRRPGPPAARVRRARSDPGRTGLGGLRRGPTSGAGAGYGLLGMRSVLEPLGGSLEAGPDEEGFVVTLRVPVWTGGGDQEAGSGRGGGRSDRGARRHCDAAGPAAGDRGRGCGGDRHEAVALVAELAPDVVLMDLRMPRCDGVEATRRIRAEHPGTQVVVLTTYADDESLFPALRAGARAISRRTRGRRRDRARGGKRAVRDAGLSPSIQRRLLERLSEPAPAAVAPVEPPERLTTRETEARR